jgi:hypothetical protein
LVEKKTGFEGNRTRIQSGFRGWCSAGSIFVQDMTDRLGIKRGIAIHGTNV